MDGEHAGKYSFYAPTSDHALCILPHEQYWLFLLPKHLRKPSKECEKLALSEIRDLRFPESAPISDPKKLEKLAKVETKSQGRSALS